MIPMIMEESKVEMENINSEILEKQHKRFETINLSI